MPRSVRDATVEVLRRQGLTTLFANPGSTEITLLADFPEDLDFVLALHEGSVVGMATGWAIANERPAVAILHTTAGLGNAVGALATARVNRAPMVVIVGQQDRRHLAFEPFLTGHLDGLAGTYPVHVAQPVRAADVPGAIARAAHEARAARGPALVIVPMDDWTQPAGEGEIAAPDVVRTATAADPAVVEELTELLRAAVSPALVAGAGADSAEGWSALVMLAERLGSPVWQEPFGARAGFPQDHRNFAGHLPAGRAALRDALAPHDVILTVGAPVFRQYPYETGRLVNPGTRLALVTDDPSEAHHSPVDLAVVGPIAEVCAGVARRLPSPVHDSGPVRPPATTVPASREDAVLSPGDVFRALADRLPRDVVIVEETPSSRPELQALVPAREPLGFLSAAMGGLGFALPAAAGVRMARPGRPVVAVVGDGSALYGIQALWSAAHYRIGVLVVVLANGRYAIMDRLAEQRGGKPPWPAFEEIDVAGLAESLGCPARRIGGRAELLRALDEVVPTLHERDTPLVLSVDVR